MQIFKYIGSLERLVITLAVIVFAALMLLYSSDQVARGLASSLLYLAIGWWFGRVNSLSPVAQVQGQVPGQPLQGGEGQADNG